MTDDLDELLSLVDDPVSTDEIAAAESRVWARLSGDAVLRPSAPVASRDRSRIWYAAAAAIVLTVAGLVAVTATRDEPSAPAVTPPAVTTLDRTQACARFRDRAGSLTALVDVASTGEGVAALGEAVTALDALAADLTAAGAAEGELDDLGVVRGGVQQASLHAADGDTSAAVTALEFARRAYADGDLSLDGCLG